jgi:hypothetical protein
MNDSKEVDMFPTVPPEDDDELQEHDDETENGAAEPGGDVENPMEELEALLGAAPEETAVEIVRYRRGGGQEYLCRFALPDFDLEELRDLYGGGRYRVTLRGHKGKYQGSKTIRIGGRPKDPPDFERAPKGPSPDDSPAELVGGLRRDLRRYLEQVRNPPPETAGGNPISMALALVSAMQETQRPYIEALLKRNQPENSIETAMNMFFQAMEYARESTPVSPDASMATQVALPALQLLNRLVDRESVQAPKLENPSTTPPADTASSRRPPWAFVLQPWLVHLQRWASAGKSPESRADFVLDELPEDMVPTVAEQLRRGGDFVVEFFALFPDCRPFEAWYRRFWAAMADAFDWTEPTDDTGEDTERDHEQTDTEAEA